MKAIVIHEFGGSDQLTLTDVPTPAPAPGEVLIQTRFAAVNPVDWKIREGYLKGMFPHGFPLIPGWDAAGVVQAVGEGVSDLSVGDAVYAYCRKPEVQWGTYAEYVTFPAEHVAPKPVDIGFAEAAAMPLASLTAWQSLVGFAELKKGETVLIHAGAGGVGSYAIQFARHLGARVITTASAGNHAYVTSLGAEVVVDYRKDDFVAVVGDLHPKGVDVVFDLIGNESQPRNYEILKKGGRLVSIVSAPDQALAEAAGVRAGFVFVSPRGDHLREIAALVNAGAVRPPPVKVFPLSDASAAQDESEGGHVRGKLVLEI
jgi:NADPH:quinone reductase-like Zn-dependent oxidoreductase